mgnify:CR=1 FL=1
MADIKTRDAVKGTIKTIDKAAIATERMKSAYAKTKDKAEQGCYADESSATEYAADRLSYGADRIKDEGIHQFNKQGQKAVKETRENIGKANVRMGADLAGNSDYREIIKAVGLEAKAAKYPSELSGGEQQRVSVARALAKKPKVLFLDEPTGALDEKTGRQVLDYICKLHTEYGFTIVMVTHNANIAEMANTVVRMNSGEIAEINVNTVQKSAYEIGW